MNKMNMYVDHRKGFIIYNRESDDDLRCLTVQRGKVLSDVSLTLSSYDRILYLSRSNKYKGFFQFE